MNIVLDVAFVIAVTAFLKQQFGLQGATVLIVAFLISLGFGFAPLISGMFPAIAPFVQVLLNTCMLFLAAAGSYDAVQSFRGK